MLKFVRILISLTFIVSSLALGQGLITTESPHDMDTSQAKLEAAIEEAGLRLVMVIDHTANAAGVQLELRPTRLVIFGNPNVGTPLMQSAQSVAIDLPQKILIWEDEAGTVFLSYNDPLYLKDRHGITDQDERLANISNALANLVATTTNP